MDRKHLSSEIIREKEQRKDHYNHIISKSGGVGTSVSKLQFLEDYSERQRELDTGKKMRSSTSPRIMIPKKWWRRKSKGQITKFWEEASSSSS